MKDSALAALLVAIAAYSHREFAPEVYQIAFDDAFPNGLAEDDAEAVINAARLIGSDYLPKNPIIVNAKITAGELAHGVSAYYAQFGTNYCPPIVAALNEIAGIKTVPAADDGA